MKYLTSSLIIIFFLKSLTVLSCEGEIEDGPLPPSSVTKSINSLDICYTLSEIASLAYSPISEIKTKASKCCDFQLESFEESPIGCVAGKYNKSINFNGENYDGTLVVGFRGTTLESPSSLIVNTAIALGSRHDDSATTGSRLLADYLDISLHPHCLKNLLGLLSDAASSRRFEISKASYEVLQAFIFRAYMFTQHHVEKVRKNFRGKKFLTLLTGHSLGGVYAQIIGNYMNINTITFNAPGASILYKPCIEGLGMYRSPKKEKVSGFTVMNLILGQDVIGTHGTPLGQRKILRYYPRKDPIYQELLREKKYSIAREALKNMKKSLNEEVEEYEKKSRVFVKDELTLTSTHMTRTKIAYEKAKKEYPGPFFGWPLSPQAKRAKEIWKSWEQRFKILDDAQTAFISLCYTKRILLSILKIDPDDVNLFSTLKNMELPHKNYVIYDIEGEITKMEKNLVKEESKILFKRQHSIDAIIHSLKLIKSKRQQRK